jgi:plastocyanin
MTKTRVLLLSLAVVSAAALVGGGATAGSAVDVRQLQKAGKSGAAGGVDPRSGGFELALGEWALSPEARAIRPGRVTFVVRNRGRVTHGFEIESRRGDDRDDDGKAETEDLRPGQMTTLTLDLAPGVYEIECSVGDHDDMGMRGLLEVRADAPLVAPRPKSSRSTVDIAAFAFKPATLRTTAGTMVTWRNADAAPHTATGKQFSSPELRKGASFRRRFTQAGTYAYICALHPAMRGKVIVAKRAAG